MLGIPETLVLQIDAGYSRDVGASRKTLDVPVTLSTPERRWVFHRRWILQRDAEYSRDGGYSIETLGIPETMDTPDRRWVFQRR